jgi:hypothetical protein
MGTASVDADRTARAYKARRSRRRRRLSVPRLDQFRMQVVPANSGQGSQNIDRFRSGSSCKFWDDLRRKRQALCVQIE